MQLLALQSMPKLLALKSMALATLEILLKARRMNASKQIWVDIRRDKNVAQEYKGGRGERVMDLNNSDDPEKHWTDFKTTLKIWKAFHEIHLECPRASTSRHHRGCHRARLECRVDSRGSESVRTVRKDVQAQVSDQVDEIVCRCETCTKERTSGYFARRSFRPRCIPARAGC